MSVPTAFTTSLLAWGLLAFPHGYAGANQTYATQQSVRWGADYLLKTLIANSTGGNVSSIVYQVRHNPVIWLQLAVGKPWPWLLKLRHVGHA